MVTTGTYLKQPFFHRPDALTRLTNQLLELADCYHWNLQAWALFPNHYHFLAESEKPSNLKAFIRALHSESATEINKTRRGAREEGLVSVLGITDYVSEIVFGATQLCSSEPRATSRDTSGR